MSDNPDHFHEYDRLSKTSDVDPISYRDEDDQYSFDVYDDSYSNWRIAIFLAVMCWIIFGLGFAAGRWL